MAGGSISIQIENLRQLVADVQAIEAAIDRIEDPLERECLRLRYIDGNGYKLMPWRDVSIAIFGDDDEKYLLSTFRLHGKALQHVALWMSGAGGPAPPLPEK